jgi:hypothetical protein
MVQRCFVFIELVQHRIRLIVLLLKGSTSAMRFQTLCLSMSYRSVSLLNISPKSQNVVPIVEMVAIMKIFWKTLIAASS